MPQIAIIIVNWNTGTLLGKCLESLERLPEKALIQTVVVVDNASSDTSFMDVKDTQFQLPVKFLPQRENLGFAKANNIGIDAISENNSEMPHIFLLNPDTEVQPGALQNMLNVFERYPKAGIVGPKLIESDGRVQSSVRPFPSFAYFVFTFLKAGFLWSRLEKGNVTYEKEMPVEQVMGAAFLIRNIAFKQLGKLDEDYWIWFEEVDYCKRAVNAGWQVLYTPTATVLHHGGVSFGQITGFRKSLPFLQSSLQYAKKHLGLGVYLVLLVLYPVSILLTIPATLVHMIQRARNKKRL